MSRDNLKIAAALIITSPFIPMLFQGEEWGATTPFLYFTDHQDPSLAQAVREGRRNEFAAFGWNPAEIPDPQAPETFATSKLNWNELSRAENAELLDWHKQLIRLRRSEAALNDGRMDLVNVRFDEENRWLIMKRGQLIVACNFNSRPQLLPMFAGTFSLVLASKPLETTTAGPRLAPESVVICREAIRQSLATDH